MEVWGDEEIMNCNHKYLVEIESDRFIDKYQLRCKECGKWIRWGSFFNRDERPSRKSSIHNINEVQLFHQLDKPFCFLCGITFDLTIDHIHELQYGGKDIIENLQILCMEHHRLKNSIFRKNWRRINNVDN